jgi:hypothetical protein
MVGLIAREAVVDGIGHAGCDWGGRKFGPDFLISMVKRGVAGADWVVHVVWGWIWIKLKGLMDGLIVREVGVRGVGLGLLVFLLDR